MSSIFNLFGTNFPPRLGQQSHQTLISNTGPGSNKRAPLVRSTPPQSQSLRTSLLSSRDITQRGTRTRNERMTKGLRVLHVAARFYWPGETAQENKMDRPRNRESNFEFYRRLSTGTRYDPRVFKFSRPDSSSRRGE